MNKGNLVTMAKSSKKLPNFIWGTLLLLIIMSLGEFIGGICLTPIQLVLYTNFPAYKDLIMLFLNLSVFLFITLAVFIRVRYIEKRKISTMGLSKDRWIQKYIKGFLIGLAMMVIVVLILYILGNVELEKNPTQPVGINALGGVLFVLIGWIIQGGTEEILTRGWFMNIIGARYNITFGLILSSIVFGFLHLLNPQVNIIAVINIILVGIFYGVYVIKSNDLWVVCGMHSAWNFAQGNIFGFEVSGINVSVSSIFDLNLVGNNFISGGVFGPEAGIVATFVLLTSIIIVFILDKKGYFN